MGLRLGGGGCRWIRFEARLVVCAVEVAALFEPESSSSRLVFSLLPRCHGECGLQK